SVIIAAFVAGLLIVAAQGWRFRQSTKLFREQATTLVDHGAEPADGLSAEIRWFFEGPIDDTVRRWFGEIAGGPGFEAISPERRTDHYLTSPAETTVGIKVRAGDSLEVKSLR